MVWHNTQAAGKCREQRILNMAGKKFLSLAYNDLFQNSYTDSDSEWATPVYWLEVQSSLTFDLN